MTPFNNVYIGVDPGQRMAVVSLWKGAFWGWATKMKNNRNSLPEIRGAINYMWNSIDSNKIVYWNILAPFVRFPKAALSLGKTHGLIESACFEHSDKEEIRGKMLDTSARLKVFGKGNLKKEEAVTRFVKEFWPDCPEHRETEANPTKWDSDIADAGVAALAEAVEQGEDIEQWRITNGS